jgi:1,4-alpha-glucan branching enzyme
MLGALPSGTIDAIVEGHHADPFAVLGLHEADGALVVRAFVPGAESVDAVTRSGDLLAHLTRLHPGGYFEGALPERTS